MSDNLRRPSFSSHASTSTPPARRPQGARKRVAPGLFVANPDNSDDDPSSPRSPARPSPITASSSSSGKTGAPIVSSYVTQGGSPSTNRGGVTVMPTIPAPQSSPRPPYSALPPAPPPADPPQTSSATPTKQPVPPQPPPQPERHLRRAFTTPVPEFAPRPANEGRSASGSSNLRDAPLIPPRSPSRALPLLPSPPLRSHLPSPPLTPWPPPNHTSQPQSTPSSVRSHGDYLERNQSELQRTASPEDAMSPVRNDSESVRTIASFGSSDMGSRRSGSVQGMIRLQVTTDNEQFTLVDITGTQTPEAIKERVFSKLRFRDDDYPTLALYRTDIGEQPDSTPVSDEGLIQLCATVGDGKATLKFLVVHTSVPESSTATVVPPDLDDPVYRSNSDRRARMAPIMTDLSAQNRPMRTPSYHSNQGSLSSVSEIFEHAGNSNSDWSEIGHEDAGDWSAGSSSQNHRAPRRSIRSNRSRRIKSSAGSSRSRLTERSLSAATSWALPPTPPPPPVAPVEESMLQETSLIASPVSRRSVDFDSPSHATDHLRKGSATPVSNAVPGHSPIFQREAAGPSWGRESAGLGLNIDLDGMDPETRALIAQFQLEEEEARKAENERRRQLQADEEYARREQQSERDVWQMMQQVHLEHRTRLQEQIDQDEIRAVSELNSLTLMFQREVAAEEQRLEELRLRQEVARTAWEAEQQEAWEEQQREAADQERIKEEQQQRGAQWPSQGPAGTAQRNSLASRILQNIDRQTSSQVPRRPTDPHFEAARQHQYPTSNPLFSQPIYQSPPSQYQPEVPSASLPQGVRRPSGFHADIYAESSNAQERIHDPRLMQIGCVTSGPPAQNGGTLPVQRQTPRARLPFAPFHNEEETVRKQSIANARSMGNLRPAAAGAPVSRPPYQGIPPRSAVTPTPAAGPEQRSYISANLYRHSSADRTQDGRYPDPSQSAPPRLPPLQISSPAGTVAFMPFPSPRPRNSGSGPCAWHDGVEPAPVPSQSTLDQGSTSPQTVQRGYASPTSPQTATTPRRPATLYEESHSPPNSAIDEDGYAPFTGSWRRRSGSASAAYRSTSPVAGGSRRASQPNAPGDDHFETLLPYAHQYLSPEQSWLSIPRSRRDTSDTASMAGTVSSGFSEATLRPRSVSGHGEEGDSNDTARQGDFDAQLQALRNQGDNEPEASLFFTPIPTASPAPLLRRPTIRPSGSKPSLRVTTIPVTPDEDAARSSTTPSDSATESEGDSRITRAKSFARPKDQPEQWHVRPEPEQLYEHLDNFFPKIDLDRPILEGGPSTPSTPAAESPSRLDNIPPPPVHPSRQPQTPTMSPRSADQARALPPPVHPSRAAGFGDRRKSIRVVVDHKRRTIQRESRNVDFNRDVYAAKQDAKKLDRRKSSSMWGHRIQEVTQSKLLGGQVPTTIPESPSTDGKPTTLTWVKGDLIGKGSYGRVYIALNVTTGDMMAVKQVELPATERDRNDRRQLGMIEALQKEIALLKDMYHPNIVTYLGCETSPEYLSIFLEYVPGGTIASIYRTPNQARFEEQLVRFFTSQVLEGLAYLHAKNIWHRDLKGDNILVDAAGVCKISDFGVSKQTSDAYDSFGQATIMKGSVFWMAPEVIHSANERTYSGKVDIWSLGCVVLEMWTGTRPWGDMEQVAAMYELFNKRARPRLPPDIHLSDIALDFMNNRCLAKDPRDRPMARDLLQHPFITSVDANWTFSTSKIGKAVARNAPKSVKATAS